MFFKLDARLSVLSEHWTQLKEKSAQRKQDLEDSLQVSMPFLFAFTDASTKTLECLSLTSCFRLVSGFWVRQMPTLSFCLARKPLAKKNKMVRNKPGNHYWRGILCIVDPLVVLSLDKLLLILQELIPFLQNQATLMRRSTVLNLPPSVSVPRTNTLVSFASDV